MLFWGRKGRETKDVEKEMVPPKEKARKETPKKEAPKRGEPVEAAAAGPRRKSAWGEASPLEVKLLRLQTLEAGVNQKEVADLLGVWVGTVRDWKNLFDAGGVDAHRKTALSPHPLHGRLGAVSAADASQRSGNWIDWCNHQRSHQAVEGATRAERLYGLAQDMEVMRKQCFNENATQLALGQPPEPPLYLMGRQESTDVRVVRNSRVLQSNASSPSGCAWLHPEFCGARMVPASARATPNTKYWPRRTTSSGTRLTVESTHKKLLESARSREEQECARRRATEAVQLRNGSPEISGGNANRFPSQKRESISGRYTFGVGAAD